MISFFKGRIKRINYFASVLTLAVFMGLMNFGVSMIAKSAIDKVYNSSSTINADSLLKGDLKNSINKEQLNVTLLKVGKVTKTESVVILILSLLITFLSFSLSFRRLHDFNKPGLLALICFLPIISRYLIIVNLIFILVLLFKKGDLSKNKFGDVDKEKDIFKIIFPRK